VKIREALDYARKALQKADIEDYPLEGEILVRLVTGLNRTKLFSNYGKELTEAQKERLSKAVQRRQAGEPSAYITGHKEFYSLDFKVDRRVLIPRPETELLLEKSLELFRKNHYITIADIGTGSGCIAISLAKICGKAEILAVDNSDDALTVASVNIEHYGLSGRIKPVKGNLLEPINKPVDMIIANLPYVKTDEINLTFEPKNALDGGKDGLDLIRELIKQAPGKLKTGGALLLEIGQGQAEEIKRLLAIAFSFSYSCLSRERMGCGAPGPRTVTFRMFNPSSSVLPHEDRPSIRRRGTPSGCPRRCT
jgi:release factor glutamine methyltransferase